MAVTPALSELPFRDDTLHQGDMKMLAASLERIQRTVREIITGLDV